MLIRRLELSKHDSSAILASLRNRSVRQDVTSQFNSSSRILAVAKGRFSDQDTSRFVFINGYRACVYMCVCVYIFRYIREIDRLFISAQSGNLGIVIEDHESIFVSPFKLTIDESRFIPRSSRKLYFIAITGNRTTRCLDSQSLHINCTLESILREYSSNG